MKKLAREKQQQQNKAKDSKHSSSSRGSSTVSTPQQVKEQLEEQLKNTRQSGQQVHTFIKPPPSPFKGTELFWWLLKITRNLLGNEQWRSVSSMKLCEKRLPQK